MVTDDVLIPGRWVRLVPVEVFGSECDEHPTPVPVPFGLCDAVPAWSDCNRAYGKIFRVDDLPNRENPDENTISVWVDESEYEKLNKVWCRK